MNFMRSATTKTRVEWKSATTLEIMLSIRALTLLKLRETWSHGKEIIKNKKKIKQEEVKILEQPKNMRRKLKA